MICNHHIRHLRSLVIATSVLLANTALAETFILKPGPGSSIQALIDGGVADGDVIQLEAGDFTAAYDALWPAARSGNADAEELIGVMYAMGLGVERDDERAFEWYLRSAQYGEVSSWVFRVRV